MTDSKAKSNAEIAARVVQGWALNDRNDPGEREALEGRIEAALSTAQSNLARELLKTLGDAEMNYQDVLLRDLFTRLNIEVGGSRDET